MLTIPSLTLKVPRGEGGKMAIQIPLEIFAYGSYKTRKCVIEYACKLSLWNLWCKVAKRAN